MTEYHRVRALKQHKLIFSQFWRLEVQDQGGSRLGFWRPLSLASDAAFSLPLHVVVPLHTHTPALSSSSYNTSHIGLGPCPNGLILFYHLLNDHI